MDLKLEVVMLPVSDVGKAKDFYETGLGCRLDADFQIEENYRIVQVTPPNSPCSLIFGDGVTSATPGSIAPLVLVVDDVAAAREELLGRGVDVSEVFHGSAFSATTDRRIPGPDPDGKSHGPFASFSHPDGNPLLLQQITERLPGRVW
jgi:catechol 2,3-dioxygenase-like lactoylglutathione lyase family enzyme